MSLQSVKNCLFPAYISNRNKDDDGWRFFNRSNGDVYWGDSDSTLRGKFGIHAVFCIPLAFFRWPSKALWVLGQMSTINGCKMGEHRWKIINVRRFHACENKGAYKTAGKVVYFFVIAESVIEQNAKDITKVATYPAAVILMELTAVGGVFFPLTARRIQSQLDWMWLMETVHGIEYGNDRGKVHEIKKALSCEVLGGNFATPCMRTWQHALEVNDIGLNNEQTLSKIYTDLKIYKSYFTESGNHELIAIHSDISNILKLYPIADQLSKIKSNRIQQLNNPFKALTSHIGIIIKYMEADAPVGSNKKFESFSKSKKEARACIEEINKAIIAIVQDSEIAYIADQFKIDFNNGDYKAAQDSLYDLMLLQRNERIRNKRLQKQTFSHA